MLLAKRLFCLSTYLLAFFVMNDIVQSQEKSMEGHLQFLLKVRGLKSKSFGNQVRSTKEILCGGGGGALKEERAMEETWIFSVFLLYLQTILITAAPGPASQFRMQVSNTFTVNGITCP